MQQAIFLPFPHFKLPLKLPIVSIVEFDRTVSIKLEWFKTSLKETHKLLIVQKRETQYTVQYLFIEY